MVDLSKREIGYILSLMGSGETIIRPGEFTAKDALELERKLEQAKEVLAVLALRDGDDSFPARVANAQISVLLNDGTS